MKVLSSKVNWCMTRMYSLVKFMSSININLVPRACDPREGTWGSGIIRCRKPGILAKIELRIHFNGQSDSSLKRIIPEPRVPSRGSQARGTRLYQHEHQPRTQAIFSYSHKKTLGTRMHEHFKFLEGFQSTRDIKNVLLRLISKWLLELKSHLWFYSFLQV